MAANKNQPQSTKAKRGLNPSKKAKGPGQSSPFNGRGLVGGGLVVLIILAVLVGTKTVSIQTGTNIKVLERQTNVNRPHKAVVARNEGGEELAQTESGAVIELYGLSEEGEQNLIKDLNMTDVARKLAHLESAVAKMARVAQGQQQMIRMVNQNHATQIKKFQEQIQNVSLQVANALASEGPTLLRLQSHLEQLTLRQDVLFFQNQWQQGDLQVEPLKNWQTYLEGQGLSPLATQVNGLIKSVETHGVVTEVTLQEFALKPLQQAQIAFVEGANPEIEVQNPPPETQTQSVEGAQKPTFWEKVKQQLSGLVEVRRVEKTPEQGGQNGDAFENPHKDALLKALKNGHMQRFWGEMAQISLAEASSPRLKQLRHLADAHLAQKKAFNQFYKTISAVPQ